MFAEEIQLFYPDLGKTLNVPFDQYPDGGPLIKLDYEDWHQQISALVLRPTSMETFMQAMFLADAFEERGRKIPNLILPFIPGARQDRLNPEGDFLFTIKSIAKMINDRTFEKVLVLDPHSSVSPALINRCGSVDLAGVLYDFKKDFDGVIAPDAGAAHRAQVAAEVVQAPLIQGSKTRDVATGKLSGFEVQVEAGKHYLVFDDICDGGGTFVGLAEKITEQGATAQLFVSHGIFSKGVDELNKHYTHITTTDSTLFYKYGVEVLPTVERMKQWLTR